jgi:hypothetical protein
MIGNLTLTDIRFADVANGSEAVLIYSFAPPLALDVKINAPELPPEVQECLMMKYNTKYAVCSISFDAHLI